MGTVTVVPYAPALAPAFAALNREWIEQHFVLEPPDVAVLEHPEEEILAGGGQIFFVLADGEPLGTCAMIPHGPGELELAKMAVTERARGRGFARLLMDAALAFARERGVRRVVLVSSRRLAPALALYRSCGFREVPLDPDELYARADIKMALDLAAEGAAEAAP